MREVGSKTIDMQQNVLVGFSVDSATKVGNLPKTGSPVDFGLLIGLGLILVASGSTLLIRRKRFNN